MKIIKLLILSICIIYTQDSFAQFDKPQFQIGVGISEPYNDLKGTYYAYEQLGLTTTLTINPDFMRNNYGGKTGINIFLKGKFNFDKYSIVRAVIGLNYNSFNTFETSQSGNIGVQVLNINNQIDTILTSINYSYDIQNYSMGIGVEVAPTSFTNFISPYFGANVNFNLFNGHLARTENRFDSVRLSYSGFRIGINFDAGIEAKISKTIGLAFGIKYDLGNLLLTKTNSGIADVIEYGKTNASLNDEEGKFYASIYGPVLNSVRREVSSKKKKISWGTIYVGVNFNLNQPDPKKQKTKSRK